MTKTKTKTTTSIINPTEIASPEYLKLVRAYKFFAKELAANFVKLAETLVTAESTLPDEHFISFCNEVGLDRDGSTYRKLMVIGKNAARFEPFLEKMPNAWTTVYKLAAIKGDEFDRVVKSQHFSPFMTANNVSEALGRKSSAKASKTNVISIGLDGCPDDEKLAIYSGIKKLGIEHQFVIKLSKAFKALTEARHRAGMSELLQIGQDA